MERRKTKGVARLLAMAAVLPLLTEALSAQVQPSGDCGPPVEELVLRYYKPQFMSDVADFVQVGQQLFGARQRITVGYSEDGDCDEDIVDRFLVLSDTIIVRDLPERADLILAKFDEMEEALYPSDAEPTGRAAESELVSFEYVPRYMSVNEAWKALGSYQRLINLKLSPGGQVQNVVLLTKRPALLIRDTAEQIAEMRRLLSSVDVPGEQANFTLYVIRGLDAAPAEAQGSHGRRKLPEGVATHLSRMLPMAYYETLSSGVLRSSLRGDLELSTAGGDQTKFKLEMRPAAFDRETGTLTLERLRFTAQFAAVPGQGSDGREAPRKSSEQSFETAVSIVAGEYTVLGSVGVDPLFVVVRMDL